MTRSSEIKVGIFFVIGMIILGILTFRIEHFGDLFKKQYRLKTKFSAAGGLQPGNPVCLAGVKVGEIEKVEVVGDKVQITMLINEGVVIREAAQTTIVSDYLLGNVYVNITLAPETSPPLKPDSFVRGVDLPGLTDMMTKLDSAIDGIRNITAPFEKGKETFESLAETAKSFKDVGPKLTQLIDTAQDIASQVKEGQGLLGKMISDPKLHDEFTETLGGIKSLTKKLEAGEGTFGKLFTDEGLYNDLKSISSDIKGITSKIEKGEGTLGRLVSDESLYQRIDKATSVLDRILTENEQNIKNALSGLGEAAPQLKETFERLNKTVAKLEAGEGTLGKLLTDAGLYDDLKSISTDIKNITAKMEKGEGTLGKLVSDETLYHRIDKATSVLDRILTENEQNIKNALSGLGEAAPQLKETFERLNKTVAKLEAGEGTLGKLLTDAGLYDDLKSISTDIKNITAKMEKGEGTFGKLLTDTKLYDELTGTMSSMKVVAENLEKGKGTMGKLFTDEEMYNSLKEAVADFKSIMDKMEKGEGTLAKLMTSDELYVELKKILQETKETMQGYKEQIPVGAFSSIVFSGF